MTLPMHEPQAPVPVAETADVKSGSIRRRFLGWLAGGLATVAGFAVAIPYLGFLLGTRRGKPRWVDLGPLTQFPVQETRRVTFENPLRVPWDGQVAHTAVYVRNEGPESNSESGQPELRVFAVNCAHLGCPVEWFQESGLFLCPCHGGVYYANGERASGPPPRGLFRCPHRLTKVKDAWHLEIQAPHFPTLHDTLSARRSPCDELRGA